MFEVEIPPFFFFSGRIIFVISSSVMAPIQEYTGEGTGEKAKTGENNHSRQCVHV